jgi:hypothetical protein
VTRLYVLVEGDTELAFVKRLLEPHLNERLVWTYPFIVATKRDRRTRAKLGRGGGHWKHWQRDLKKLIEEHGADARFTTLFDLYGLPEDFPEISIHRAERDTAKRVEALEAAMAAAVGDPRFLPYLQRHEFEAFVLAALDRLPAFLQDDADRAGVEALRASLGTAKPEDVNDGKETAPSKRLAAQIPGYRKVTLGPLAVEALGLAALREKCPRFNAWVRQLETLGGVL